MNENLNRNSVSKSKSWQDCYVDEQAGWERGETHPALIEWCETGTIKPPSHVAIPGCGRGHEAIYLAQKGFVVSAIDFASAPIEYLKHRAAESGVSVRLHQHDVFEFASETKFDVVYEQTCLCAIAPDRRKEYEQAIARWLKPGGLLLVLFMQAQDVEEGPPFDCSLEDMKQLFPTTRWSWENDTFPRFDHPSGPVHELATVLKKTN